MDFDTVTLEPIDVMVVTDTGNMPEAAGQAFQRLERALPSLQGRKFYGYWDPDAKAYFACVASRGGEDAEAMGLQHGTIPGGRYRRAHLKGEPPELYSRIGTTFEEMSRHDELDLLVPVR